MIESIQSLFERDLAKLKSELELFPSENAIWSLTEGINNSAGHLTLHLCGNLKHFIGHIIGGSIYKRNRTEEFQGSAIPLKELIILIDVTTLELKKSLNGLNSKDLSKDYPLEVLGFRMSVEFFLIHLNGHLNYHLGQINYLRKFH